MDRVKNFIVAKNEAELNTVDLKFYTLVGLSEKMGGAVFKVREQKRA